MTMLLSRLNATFNYIVFALLLLGSAASPAHPGECTKIVGGPEITGHNQTYTHHWIAKGEAISITITCQGGQAPLATWWEVNDIPAASGETFLFDSTLYDRGAYQIVAICEDSAGNCDSQLFHIEVFDSDAFSFILLPDTQYYAKPAGGGQPIMFVEQTNWIQSAAGTLNIAWVAHLGDVVNSEALCSACNNQSSNSECYTSCGSSDCTWENLGFCEWGRADEAMGRLTTPGFTTIPFSIAVGDHDHDPPWGENIADRSLEFFDRFFPVSRFESIQSVVDYYDEFGTFESNDASNSYHLFSAGGFDFLLIVYEFEPRNEVLNWASQLVAAYPDRRVMLVTHQALLTGTQWDNLSKLHRNIFLVAGGHSPGPDFESKTGDFGNTVHRILANHQFEDLGGNGYLRILVFEPGRNLVSNRTYSPFRDINPDANYPAIKPNTTSDIHNFDFEYVMNGDPIAVIRSYPDEPPTTPPSSPTVVFDGTDSFSFEPNIDIIDYHWDYGDGNTQSGAVVTHTFSDIGTYEVELSVLNSAGNWASTSSLIDVPLVFPEGSGFNWHGDVAGGVTKNGDVTRDGYVDQMDLEYVIDHFGAFTELEATGEGVIDEYDILSVLCNWGRITGDVDRNCSVNVNDLFEIIAYWGECSWPCAADIASFDFQPPPAPGPDGVVDDLDYDLVEAYFNVSHLDCQDPPTTDDMALIPAGMIDPNWLDQDGFLDVTACELLNHWFENPAYDD